MRSEIHDRLNTIVENDANLKYSGNTIFKTFENEYPSRIDGTKLPCVIWMPRQDNGYDHLGGPVYRTTVEYEGRVYLQQYGEGLSTIQNIRAIKFPDLFRNAFLSRPHLDYNDDGLSGMCGEITFRIASDLLRPMDWPIGNRAPLYWGFAIRLTVPYEDTIDIAI